MYQLENNVGWTEELKNAFKHGITKGKIKYIDDNNQEVVIDYDSGLKNFKIYDEKNIKGQGFIGQATARQVDVELLDTTNATNLENKEIEVLLGADYDISGGLYKLYVGLPEEYQQVEYIESTGTQCILTQITGSSRWHINAQCTELTSGPQILLGRDSTGAQWFGITVSNYWGTSSLDTSVTNVLWSTRANSIINFGSSSIEGTVNDEPFSRTGTEAIGAYRLFKLDSYPYKGKLWYAKCYQNNILVANFVPCYRKSDNEIGLYETISNTFYENVGTGTFNKGADINPINTNYINYGKFIVNQAPENDITNGIIKITAFDYMIKFNDLYIPGVEFPCSMKEVLDDLCLQSGVELATENFANMDFVVDNNQFEGKPRREVLRHIAKSAFSWARIGQDNKLYLDYENKDAFDFKLVEIDGNTYQKQTEATAGTTVLATENAMTNWDTVQNLVNTGKANTYFNIGDILEETWVDRRNNNTSTYTYGNVPLRVVHIDDITSENDATISGMFLEWAKEVPNAIMFKNYQALQCFDGTGGTPHGLPAGKYCFYVTAIPNYSTAKTAYEGKYLCFEITQPIPDEGILTGSSWGNTATWKMETRTSALYASTSIEIVDITVETTQPTGYTYLGATWGTDVGYGILNHPEAVIGGDNTWKDSDLRQWLNSTETYWWTKKTRYDRQPQTATQYKGFLSGYSDDFVNKLKTVKIGTYSNTLKGDGSLVYTYDKVFVGSNAQFNCTTGATAQDNRTNYPEGKAWDYYVALATGQSNLDTYGRFKNGSTYDILKKYPISSNTANGFWSRSVYLNYVARQRSLSSAGRVYYGNSSSGTRMCPVFVI